VKFSRYLNDDKMDRPSERENVMDAETIAQRVAAELRENPYFLAVTLNMDGEFPYVEFWNDRVQITEVIVCYASPADEDAARIYANVCARAAQQQLEADIEGPVDVLASVVTADYEIRLLE
jgi:hypothetical protein